MSRLEHTPTQHCYAHRGQQIQVYLILYEFLKHSWRLLLCKFVRTALTIAPYHNIALFLFIIIIITLCSKKVLVASSSPPPVCFTSIPQQSERHGNARIRHNSCTVNTNCPFVDCPGDLSCWEGQMKGGRKSHLRFMSYYQHFTVPHTPLTNLISQLAIATR